MLRKFSIQDCAQPLQIPRRQRSLRNRPVLHALRAQQKQILRLLIRREAHPLISLQVPTATHGDLSIADGDPSLPIHPAQLLQPEASGGSPNVKQSKANRACRDTGLVPEFLLPGPSDQSGNQRHQNSAETASDSLQDLSVLAAQQV